MALRDGQRRARLFAGDHQSSAGARPVSLLRANKRRRRSDVGAIGPVRNLCTYMLITHLFPAAAAAAAAARGNINWGRPQYEYGSKHMNMDAFILRAVLFCRVPQFLVFMNGLTFFFFFLKRKSRVRNSF